MSGPWTGPVDDDDGAVDDESVWAASAHCWVRMMNASQRRLASVDNAKSDSPTPWPGMMRDTDAAACRGPSGRCSTNCTR